MVTPIRISTKIATATVESRISECLDCFLIIFRRTTAITIERIAKNNRPKPFNRGSGPVSMLGNMMVVVSMLITGLRLRIL